MPKGFLTCIGVLDADGHEVSLQNAVRYGWLKPVKAPTGWDIGTDEVPLGSNLFLDAGRQYLAYAFGYKAPVSNYAVSYFGVGTGSATPNATDTALSNPVPLTGQTYLQLVDTVDFPAPFVARILYTLGAGMANGYLITEFGFYSGDQTLLIHLTRVGINKTSDFAPQLAHRCRFAFPFVTWLIPAFFAAHVALHLLA